MRPIRTIFATAIFALAAEAAGAADLVALSPETWERYAPHGKEADAIYGDFALVNDKVVAVVGQPKPKRNANMTVRKVGGGLIDLTRRDHQNDQLSAFYPGAHIRDLRFAGIDVDAPQVYEVAELERTFVKAKRITLRFVAEPRPKTPDVTVAYTLEDGWPYVLATTTYANHTNVTLGDELVDAVRADHSFDQSPAESTDLFWVDDRWFGQTYGWVAEGHEVRASKGRETLLRYAGREGKVRVELAPGESYKLTRRLIPGANPFDIRRVADQIAGRKDQPVRLEVKEKSGKPVADAEVVLKLNGKAHARGRTDEKGTLVFGAPGAQCELTVTSPSRGTAAVTIAREVKDVVAVELPDGGAVVAKISNAQGGPIPCKVQFIGKDGVQSPDFGPDSGEFGIKNVQYSNDGRFRRELAPGSYDVIVSYGPEYDAIFTKLDVAKGKDTPLEATLARSVRTPGWISADFHSHSSPSGDNTSSQLGRVLNLLCEHVEFAPCTEHNRISTYTPHLRRLGVETLMATCSGMEMTGQPLPINHQNAFPLVMRPHTQDNGAPPNDEDPEVQIERLALWDAHSEKLVQVNHPDMGWMFFDRNGDGTPDGGYSGMHNQMDVIEVHPPHTIFEKALIQYEGRTHNNPILNWLQLLNQGRRIPGVVNTDAHYNFHGSGFLRNYLKSPTDDPASVETLDMVHAAEQGHVIMTNGPYLEVKLRAQDGSTAEANPGDDLAISGGKANVRIRVQCPNWFDVDRVQVFVNGRAVESLNFTREKNSERFSSEVVKFEQDIAFTLEKDAHVIVAAIGEHSKLGPVMGPDHEKDLPVAVSNPIFVDVDGGGFTPNKDTLDAKLPVKAR